MLILAFKILLEEFNMIENILSKRILEVHVWRNEH